MNISHLRYAVEVEKTGSITQAADNLHMGQPNLSKAIRELESSYGLSIFQRTSKGVIPTQRGKTFLASVKTLLSQIDEMESLYNANRVSRQSLRISVPRASYITYSFTRFLNRLDPSYPIDIDYKETGSSETIQNIIQGHHSLGIIRYPSLYERHFLNQLEEKQLRHEFVWEFEVLALMSQTHPLAQRSNLLYADLIQYTEIVHGDFSIPNLHHSARETPLIQPQELKRIYVYERGSQFDLLTQVPTTYIWTSPVPQPLILQHDLVQRTCNVPNHKYKDVLIYANGYHLNTAEQAFLHHLYQVRDEVSLPQP